MPISLFRNGAASQMLRLGPFTFGLATAAYKSFSRQMEVRWASIDRLGDAPAEQFIGQGIDQIRLAGTIYPTFDLAASVGGGRVAGTYQIERMRTAARMGVPHMLVDGRGNVMGRWIILSVDEDGEEFETHGAPQRQEFDIRIRRYPDQFSKILDSTMSGLIASGISPLSIDGAAGLVADRLSSELGGLAQRVLPGGLF